MMNEHWIWCWKSNPLSAMPFSCFQIWRNRPNISDDNALQMMQIIYHVLNKIDFKFLFLGRRWQFYIYEVLIWISFWNSFWHVMVLLILICQFEILRFQMFPNHRWIFIFAHHNYYAMRMPKCLLTCNFIIILTITAAHMFWNIARNYSFIKKHIEYYINYLAMFRAFGNFQFFALLPMHHMTSDKSQRLWLPVVIFCFQLKQPTKQPTLKLTAIKLTSS